MATIFVFLATDISKVALTVGLSMQGKSFFSLLDCRFVASIHLCVKNVLLHNEIFDAIYTYCLFLCFVLYSPSKSLEILPENSI